MRKILIIISLIIPMICGCKKFLEEKPNQKLVLLSSVSDLQAILEDNINFNERQPNATEAAADNYSLTLASFNNLEEYARNIYSWNKSNQFAPGGSNSWASSYLQVFNPNVVLENLDQIPRTPNDEISRNTVKGSALFIRSKCFFQVAQIWALSYDKSNAASTPGIPLRLTSNFNETSTRSTLEETYQQITSDLRIASSLLPVVPLHVLRPSKPAALGLLARVFLSMNETDSCLKYTLQALVYKNNLMDYNGSAGINMTAEYPFQRFNPEVIYDSQMASPAGISTGGLIDKPLYDSYETNDLRKTMFHRSPTTIGFFKGSYSGTLTLFNGLATDELYLMHAECLARKGQRDEALVEINKLLISRWKKGTPFQPLTATTAEEALSKILLERRKELVFRGLRWMDIKRLNLKGENIVLIRNLNGTEYRLEPNDKRFAMAIPEDIIAISGIAQNSR